MPFQISSVIIVTGGYVLAASVVLFGYFFDPNIHFNKFQKSGKHTGQILWLLYSNTKIQ